MNLERKNKLDSSQMISKVKMLKKVNDDIDKENRYLVKYAKLKKWLDQKSQKTPVRNFNNPDGYKKIKQRQNQFWYCETKHVTSGNSKR